MKIKMPTNMWNQYTRSFCYTFLLFAVAAFCSAVQAQESLGILKIDDLTVRTTINSLEDTGGDFSLYGSSLGARWVGNANYSAQVRLGSRELINYTNYYADATTTDSTREEVGFYEAYGQYVGAYGTIRAGLIPLDFGRDGRAIEALRVFERSSLFREHAVGLRDMGVSFLTSHNGFFTQLIFHNGEVDLESDGETWVTGRWGYQNSKNFTVSVSGQTGRVKPTTTSGSSFTLAGVDSSASAHWRHGVLTFEGESRHWDWGVEFGGGEVEQRFASNGYFVALTEVMYRSSKSAELSFRWDHFDPNNRLPNDTESRLALGFNLKSDNGISKLILTGVKVLEEKSQIANDEVRVAWVLTPMIDGSK
jgi:hypothetical protein